MIEKVTRINTFHAEMFAYLLTKMKSTPDGDGTLLDNSMIVYGSAINDGNSHSHVDLPVLIAGHAGGLLKGGRHMASPKGTPMTNLYRTLLDRLNVHPESIGDSTGTVDLSEV
jgi:hypothetical protein